MTTISSDLNDSTISEKYLNRVEKLPGHDEPATPKAVVSQPDHWYQKVLNAIPKEIYQSPLQQAGFFSRWTSWIRGNYIPSAQEIIQNQSRQVVKQSLDRQAISRDGQLSFSGVAILATYLQEKKGVSGLYVCESTQAFIEKLVEICKESGDTRAALIVSVDLGNTQSYKIMVGVEKKGSSMKLAILNSFGINSKTIDRISQSKLNLPKTKIYISSVQRRDTYQGETFALRDGIAFLKDPSFFDTIQTENIPLINQLSFESIQRLPPEFMKCGSLAEIKKYLDENPTLPKNALTKYKYIYRNSAPIKNYYTAVKSFKYHLFVLKTLETMSDKEIQEIVSKSLVLSKRPAPAKEDTLEYYVKKAD